ncbi:MAG: heme-binding protein [Burkholderiaceae bacterium]
MNTHTRPLIAGCAFAWMIASLPLAALAADEATFTTKSMTPEIALRAAQAALASCREAGYQVSVAVVDRSGILQAFVRDRFAGAHSARFAQDKAWTSASFRIPTADLGEVTQPGKPESGIRDLSGVATVGGGLPIDAGGSHVGAIGVSGAPGGEADTVCARAGIDAVADDLAF